MAAPKKKVARRSSAPVITSDVTKAVVDELPPDRRPSARELKYANVLADVREKVGAGRAVQIATFIAAGGAAAVKRALEAGERYIDGDVGDWQFDARRLEGEDGGSVLYATLRPRPEAKQ